MADMPVTFPPGEWLEMHALHPEYAMVAAHHVMVSHVDEHGAEEMDGLLRLYTFIFVLPAGPFDTPEDEGGSFLDRTIALTVPEQVAHTMAQVVCDMAEGRRGVLDEPLVYDEREADR